MKIKDHFLTQETFKLQDTKTPGVWKTYPIPENISKYYDSDNYISHHQDDGTLREKLYKFLQGFNLTYKKNIIKKEISNHSKILDYGCGAGEFIKFIENDFKTYGLEPNEDARKAAEIKTTKTTIISNLDELEDSSLDIITLWHVFEHVENQDETLSNFYKKLKTNGKLIIAVPNPTSYDAMFYKEYWAAYDVPRHIFHFSRNGMVKLMTNDKWKIKKIKPLLLDSFYIAMLSEKYKKSQLFWIKAAYRGAISNFKAYFNGQYSSLIYIIEKK